MYLISKIIGIIALLIMIVGLFPLLGWLNWIVIPIAEIGLLVGAFSKYTGGVTLNGTVLVVAMIRLFIGGGFI